MKAIFVLSKLLVGGALGWWLSGLATDRVEVKLVAALGLGYFCQTYFVQMLIGLPFHRPEGGTLPTGFPAEAQPFDSELVAARYVVRSLPPTSRSFAKGLRRSRELVRSAAEQFARAGYADAAREILDLRTPFSGDAPAEEAWATVIEAARAGIVDGEASTRP